MIVRSTLLFVLVVLLTTTHARPYKDSPIKSIIVPYQPNVISGHPYQFPKKALGETRHVIVPEKMDIMPRFNLEPGVMAMGSYKGMPVNFVDGAYPVYYMPSNVNGQFNGKISLLA